MNSNENTATAEAIARMATTDHPGIVYATELRQVARHFGIKYTTKCETFDKVKAAIASAVESASL